MTNTSVNGEPQSLMVPKLLCGEFKTARSCWRSVVEQAIRLGSWQQLIPADTFCPIEQCGGKILMSAQPPIPKGDHFHAGLVQTELFKISERKFDTESDAGRQAWYECLRDLSIEGCSEFWFCLGFLAGDGRWFPLGTSFDAIEEKQRVSYAILSKVVFLWDKISSCEKRFSSGMYSMPWPWWYTVITALAYDLGVQQSEVIAMNSDNVRDARIRIQSWLNDNEMKYNEENS